MIQPAALPTKTNAATAAGTLPGTGENAGIPAGFAALLALNLGDSAEGALPDASSAATLLQSIAGKLAGKAGGKNLPVGLPEGAAAAAKDGLPLAIGDAQDEAGIDPGLAIEGEAEPQSDLPVGPAIPAFPIPAPAQQAIDAIASAAAKPQSASDNQAGNSKRSEVLANVLARFANGQPANANGKPTPAIAATVATGTAAPAVNTAGGTAQPAPSAETAGEPKPASQQMQLQLQLVPEKAPAARQTAPRAALAMIQAASPAPAAASQPAQVTVEISMNAEDAALQSAGQAQQSGDAPARPGRTVAAATQLLQTEAGAEARTAKLAPELVQNDPATSRAADLQPVLAVREAQALVQPASNAPQTAPAAASQPGQIDFAALVDRLVEAREAAAPQAVKATIAHTEFGRVSLHFDQSNGGLSVSMASSDPDFAPAVQAAAASGQASNSGDNGSAPRQDAANQQSANLASGQQQQSQGSARGNDREQAETARRADNAPDRAPQDTADSAERDGIYA